MDSISYQLLYSIVVRGIWYMFIYPNTLPHFCSAPSPARLSTWLELLPLWMRTTMGSCRPESEQIMKHIEKSPQCWAIWWILFESSSWSVSHLRPQSLLMDWQRWAWIWRLGGRQYCSCWSIVVLAFCWLNLVSTSFFMFRIVVLTTGCHSSIVCLCIMFVCCCPRMEHLNVKQMSSYKILYINMCFNLIL